MPLSSFVGAFAPAPEQMSILSALLSSDPPCGTNLRCLAAGILSRIENFFAFGVNLFRWASPRGRRLWRRDGGGARKTFFGGVKAEGHSFFENVSFFIFCREKEPRGACKRRACAPLQRGKKRHGAPRRKSRADEARQQRRWRAGLRLFLQGPITGAPG